VPTQAASKQQQGGTPPASQTAPPATDPRKIPDANGQISVLTDESYQRAQANAKPLPNQPPPATAPQPDPNDIRNHPLLKKYVDMNADRPSDPPSRPDSAPFNGKGKDVMDSLKALLDNTSQPRFRRR
jgi:hypothetical protein